MDVLAHGLWGGMLAGWRKRFGLAFFFGVCPDVFSFGLWAAVRAAHGSFQRGRPPLDSLPGWIDIAYSVTHSLIIAVAVWAVLWWLNRELAVPFSAWIIHILLDIPTHSHSFFPTPFLYPLSDFTVDGISWGRSWFMILNYSALLILAVFWIMARHRRRAKSSLRVQVQSPATPACPEGSSSSRSA